MVQVHFRFQHVSTLAFCRMVRVFGVFRGYQIRPLIFDLRPLV